MNDSNVWAIKPRVVYSASQNPSAHNDSNVRYTWAGPINSQLYGDSLNQLTQITRYNLAKFERMNSAPQQSRNKHSEQSIGHSSWHDSSVMFAPRSLWNSPTGTMQEDDVSSHNSDTGPRNFCYLCSTMEEHRLHMQVPKKMKGNARPKLKYIAPPPRVRIQMTEDLPLEHYNNRYKIVVWTGDKPESLTDAKVFVTITGNKNVLHRTQLYRGSLTKKFFFLRGSVETFFVKAPKLGNLEVLTLEHDCENTEPRRSWYCEKIEVTCMKTQKKWLFVCNNWLSFDKGDFMAIRDLYANAVEKTMQEYTLIVRTGKKQLAGTNARVFVTFYGVQGSSPKCQLLADNMKNRFQKGSVDEFTVKFPDIGKIRSMRIEHDNKGFASGWYLERIDMQSLTDPKIRYHFVLNGWIAKDIGDGHLWRDIKAKTKLPKEITSAPIRPIVVHKGKETVYEVTVRTGDQRSAGTDANVYIIIQGRKGKTKELLLDDHRNNFERGMTEQFKVKAFDVGPIESIIIGHDNKNPGAGWFCEDVKVRRKLAKDEQEEFLRKVKTKGKPKDKRKKLLSEKLKTLSLSDLRRSKLDEESESEDEDVLTEKDVFNVDGNPVKIPEYEDYKFVCHSWLALDEGDGLLQRELKPEETKTF
ncbi:unnamed protein product [Lymnaea stagnalis]|uniref:PLAT domain-containing protein n=1 Tax=Lymnaea stagnalis TaxID=6523 RepID=A0AAV2GY97_LYMST